MMLYAAAGDCSIECVQDHLVHERIDILQRYKKTMMSTTFNSPYDPTVSNPLGTRKQRKTREDRTLILDLVIQEMQLS